MKQIKEYWYLYFTLLLVGFLFGGMVGPVVEDITGSFFIGVVAMILTAVIPLPIFHRSIKKLDEEEESNEDSIC